MSRSKLIMRPRGFTLIEVLAALVIVSLGMLGAIQAVTQSAGNGAYLRDKTLAHWIAMNRLTEVRLDAKPPSTDDTSGELDYAKQHWHWSMKVSKTTVASMLRMDVSVGPGDGKDTLATVTGFYGGAIAQPAPSSENWNIAPPAGQSGGQPQPPAATPPTGTPTNPSTSSGTTPTG